MGGMSEEQCAVRRLAGRIEPGGGREPEWEAQFLSLPCPVMLIFGELSLPDDDVDNLKQKGVEVKIIPAAGHSMSWENPSALAQTLAGCMTE